MWLSCGGRVRSAALSCDKNRMYVLLRVDFTQGKNIRMNVKIAFVYALVCVSGGSRSGVSAVQPQFPGPRSHHALCDSSGASSAVCLSHHVLPVERPTCGAQIHPQNRVYSGAVHTYPLLSLWHSPPLSACIVQWAARSDNPWELSVIQHIYGDLHALLFIGGKLRLQIFCNEWDNCVHLPPTLPLV